jgi:Fur family ferric uptake transcriptional regulator
MSPCLTCIEVLRESGHRITPQREMIIEALLHGAGHMTAETVYQVVHPRARSLNLATVYRTLDLLVEQGLAMRSESLDGPAVYAGVHHGPHIHLVCRKCGKLIKADQQLVEPLSTALDEKYSFKATLDHITVFGLCASCRESE